MNDKMKSKYLILVLVVAVLVIGGYFFMGPTKFSRKAISPPQPSVISFEGVVWRTDKTIATESDVKNLFSTSGQTFWDEASDTVQLRHGLLTPSDTTPLFDQMGINTIDLISVKDTERWGPEQWIVGVPAITQNASWRVGEDGYIEESSMECEGGGVPAEPLGAASAEGEESAACILVEVWRDVGYIWFLIDQQSGVVRVIG